MDRFVSMQAFVRVVELGTFTKAAEGLNMPKATLTRAVQELEAHLRTQLLNRTTRRVSVTPDGAAYYERAKRLLVDLDEVEASLATAGRAPKGRIRVDVPGSLGRMILIPALPEFFLRYPEIQIELGVSDRPSDLLGEQVDCVLRGGEISDPSLIARRIGEFDFRLCATPEYLRRHGTPQHPSELESAPHRVVSYFSARTGQIFPFELKRGGEALRVTGRSALAVNDGSAYMEAGLAHLGVMRGIDFMVDPLIAKGQLVALFTDWELERLPIHVAFPPNRHLSTRLRVFVDWAVELLGRYRPR